VHSPFYGVPGLSSRRNRIFFSNSAILLAEYGYGYLFSNIIIN